jgi:hypothetical protein
MNIRILISLMAMGLFNFFGCKSDKKTDSQTEMDQKMQDIIDKSFDEYNNRKIYTILTSEIIKKTHDDQLVQTIYDNIETNFEEGEQYTLDKVNNLTKGQQAIFSVWWVEAEVNNGGFNQFFFNSSGQFGPMSEAGFELLNAAKFANLMRRANSIFAENKERLEEYDDGTMESFSESYKENPLNILDEEFYELYNTESLNELRIDYIRNHLSEFTQE